MSKVIVISIDGMRPDGLLECGNRHVDEVRNMSTYSLCAKTVFPSITLPCHMSMFHSVPPQRHGILSNDYIPQVHSIKGLFERAADQGKCCSMYYGWEPLRDICRPGSLRYSRYIWAYAVENGDVELTKAAQKDIDEAHPDLAFLYMVETDEKGGHDNGWMSDGYFYRLSTAFDCAWEMVEKYSGEYSVIITADHGGHDRGHGSDMPEDMTIPMFYIGKEFEKGKERNDLSILDLTPTAANILGIFPSPEWEGRILCNN